MPTAAGPGIAELLAVCAQDSESWSCPPVVRNPDEAILAWAANDWSFMTATQILLNSRLREAAAHLPGLVAVHVLGADGLAAAAAAGEEFLSGSEGVLLRLAANLAHGNTDAGAGLDLTRLWSLDGHHRAVVLNALRNNLTARQ